MSRCAISVIFCLFYCIAACQFPDTKWVLGYAGGEGIEVDSFGLTILDFEANQLQLSEELEVDYWHGVNNTSISSADSLLYYFNGLRIFDGSHNLVLNGDDMYVGESSNGYSIPQGSLILPRPGSNNDEYYLITTHADWNEDVQGSTGAQLQYSIIRRDLLGNESEIILKNQLLIQDTVAGGQLTCTKHGNGRDWWILWRYWDSNIFIRFLLSPEGLHRFPDLEVGSPTPSGLGQAVFSPDGSKYGLFNTISSTVGVYVNIYDFDRCDGSLSNQVEIHFPHDGGAGGASISPNSRFLYIPSLTKIYQYDLWADDIENSRITVANYDGFLSPFVPATFYLGQLARDGKIYVSSPNGVMSLTRIEYPDRLGQACSVNQHAIQLPVFSAFGIPNFPNHRLGPLDGSSCDTLGIDNIPLSNFRVDQSDENYLSFYFQDLSAYEPTVWSWTFGDGTASQDTSPVHLYQEAGTYQVCLRVINENGSHISCQTIEVGTVNVDDIEQAITIELFPNPFQQQFSIVFNDYYPRQASVSFFNATGRQVHTQQIFRGWNTVDGVNWPAGIYFYEVWDGAVKLAQGKVVKQ